MTSHVAKGSKGLTLVRGAVCPDGVRRTFILNSGNPHGENSGFVTAYANKGRYSVSGYIKRQGRGWKFHPHYDGKNTHLVRPAAFAVNTRVRITDPEAVASLQNRVGTVVGVVWDYMTATYRLEVAGRKTPVEIRTVEPVV